MHLRTLAHINGLGRSAIWFVRVAVAVTLLATALGPVTVTPLKAQVMTTVTIEARDRDTNALITDFRYIINKDIAHDNASTTIPESYSPLIATGDDSNPTVILPEGKYLVTVLAGHVSDPPDAFTSPYKMWGEHFTLDGSVSALTVSVPLVANPLPIAQIQARVFHDNLMVNGEDDIPLEDGLAGFHVVIGDPVGEVTVDFFGNPICTEYDGTGGSTPLGDPVPGTGGFCATDSTGYVTIPNLPPGKYEVEPIPPDGSGWIQTTTIEGTHHLDAWIEEGADGLSTEEGFTQAAVWFGFVRPCSFGSTADDCPTNNTAGTGTITGKVRTIALDTEAPGPLTLGPAVFKPYIALNNIGGGDEQVWMGRGNADGTFTIPDVPAGLYQLVIWDFPQDHIIQFRTVRVGEGESVAVGDIGIPRWFGTIKGYTYIDNGKTKTGATIPGGAGNGVRDCLGDPDDVADCEPGLPGQDLDVRHKDGTIQYATFTDPNGYYEFPEYFEWEHFLIWEVGFGRFAQGFTAAYETDDLGVPLGYPDDPIQKTAESGAAALLQAQLTWAGSTQWIDTGKMPWGSGQNGGISGIVYYATTRNEFDPRLAAAEDYEPGIPGVTINVYEADLNGSGQPIACTAVGTGCPLGQGELKRTSNTPLDSVETDSWFDNLPTDCTFPDFYGTGLTSDPECHELPRTWLQVKDGVFDGGWAFEDVSPGKYIVEVVPPDGYQVIKEEDQNTDQGDDYIPMVPPPPCAGPLHLVNDPRNPADGEMTPLCDSRFVTVRDGFNAGAEFFLMIDNALPPPGLLRGLLLDDLTLELNPASPIYAEKRGIPNAPIGILDFEGNEIARAYSDGDGYWEVLLPSTYTALCPIPSGICPGMYQVVGNYPGTPQNPDPQWNPNYGTLRLVFDIWPGKTTYADVAIFPITGFVQDPASGFEDPPVCDISTGTPDLQSVSQPYGSVGTSFTIAGAGFGATQGSGSVTLDGVAQTITGWSDTAIGVTVAGVTPGARQLLVRNSSGATGPVGITFHVLGTGYNPTQIHVDGATGSDTTGTGSVGAPYKTIQKALDVTPDGRLILVHPGVYFESLLVDERVKLQGYGTSGPGSTVIDGRFFNFGGISAADFAAKIAAVAYDGPATVPMGQVITVLAENGEFTSAFNAQIDGFAIRGGSRVRGNRTAPAQGGAVYGHAFTRFLNVSNNLVQSNGGNLGGALVFGRPNTPNPDSGNALDNQNDSVRMHHNRVLNNGGVSLAGAIALFNGTENYQIDHNVICGNYSAEYGGGISHWGMSPGGKIHDNEILFNYAFDEGGGVMIAGEEPAGNNPELGSGAVTVERNRFQGNVTNDDGGALRVLLAAASTIRVVNNLIVNNLATDHGGGISIDEATDVRIINNTIAKNISTSTAEDAPIDPDATPAVPGAIVTLPQGAGVTADQFANPVLFNNILWENAAYYLDGTGGVASAGYIDLEKKGTGAPGFLNPRYSILTVAYGGGSNNIVGSDPQFLSEVDTQFVAVAFTGDPSFVTVLIQSSPGDPQGDYHVTFPTTPARNTGTSGLQSALIGAPCDDFDGDGRPNGAAHDIGADEEPGVVGCPPPVTLLYFSTPGTLAVPGVAGPYDDADIYTWTGVGFTRLWDASASSVPAGADVDALYVVDSDTFYLSFNNDAGVDLPGPLTAADVQDEDVVLYDAGVWSVYFNGSDVGLSDGGNNEDVDAFDILPDGSVLISTLGNPVPSGPALSPAPQDEDLLRCVGTFGATTTCTWSYYFDGSDVALNTAASEDLDGVAVSGADVYLSALGNFTVTGGFSGQGRDVFICTSATTGAATACASFTMYFDGSANLLADLIDAFDVP